MTLEFEKLITQIQTMGRYTAHLSESLSERGERAKDMLAKATDLDAIWQKIKLADDRDAGYRGAAPFTEAINEAYGYTNSLNAASIVAVDGSQIYPDQHGTALYYLTNIGAFIYHHGTDDLPEQYTYPELAYAESQLRDRHGNVIKNAAVNARRDVNEIEAIAALSGQLADYPVTIIGLRDGPLLWWLSTDVPDYAMLEANYRAALTQMYKIDGEMQRQHSNHMHLVGYVDRHDSRFVIRLLYLLDLPDEDIKRSTLETSGDLEGLNDKFLFTQLLQPGERSAIMIQRSPQNKDYKKFGDEFEIAFFYLNVGTYPKPNIVRIEIPMWVAKVPQSVNDIQSLILQQCNLMGGYPYALTRADEMAVVRGQEKAHLNNMIETELIRNKQDFEKSAKQLGKDVARQPKQRYVRSR